MKFPYFLAVLFCFSSNIYSQQKLKDQPSTILWKVVPVNHPEVVSYILGSDHRYGEKFLNSIPVIKEKVLSSEVVVAESGLPDSASRQKKLTQEIPYTKLFNEEEIKLLDSFLLSHHMNTVRQLDSVHFPVNLLSFFVSLEIMASKNIAFKENSAMDNVILHWSADAQKSIIALDSGMTIRKNVLSFGLSDKEVAKTIVSVIKKPELITDDKKLENDDYGNLTLNYHFSKKPDIAKDSTIKHLLVDRNEFWMPKLYALLSSKNCFVVVGNAHLKYRNGILKSLSEKGFVITPVAISRDKTLSE
jgi:uncharacterized protein YbaP (TraB family)